MLFVVVGTSVGGELCEWNVESLDGVFGDIIVGDAAVVNRMLAGVSCPPGEGCWKNEYDPAVAAVESASKPCAAVLAEL